MHAGMERPKPCGAHNKNNIIECHANASHDSRVNYTVDPFTLAIKGINFMHYICRNKLPVFKKGEFGY